MNERYLEFGSEAIRKYDLLRWNLFDTKIAEAKANLEKLAKNQAPYQNVPQYMYFKTPTAIGPVQYTRSFYRPSPTSTAAPAGTVRVNWAQAINAAYIANTRPAVLRLLLEPPRRPAPAPASRPSTCPAKARSCSDSAEHPVF